MEIQNYEYEYVDEDYKILFERKEELIKKAEGLIRKGGIPHYQILRIVRNNDEINFLYNWLHKEGINIRGKNGRVSKEDINCPHMLNLGKCFTPKVLDDEEQERLFLKLNSFSSEDKTNNIPEYLKVREQLIERNMKLAKWVTGWESISKIKLSLEDKIQMAYVGLIDAVDKYDPSKGFRFSTYAVKAIYRRIIREASKQREIKRSNDIAKQLVMIQEIKDQILINFGREAKSDEISDMLDISLQKIQELEVLQKLMERESWEQIESDRKDIEKVFERLSDGDMGTQFDNEYILDGVYSDKDEIYPVGFRKEDMVYDDAMTKLLKEDLNEVLSTLPDREKEVLIKRFGLNDEKARTLADIGREYNVSPEQISQIEQRALMRLRRPEMSIRIWHYVEDFDK